MSFHQARSAAISLAMVSPLLVLGCVTLTPEDGSSDNGGTSSTAAAEVTELYGALPTATPNKLRGVWSATQTSTDATSDLRLRFDANKVIAGVRCVFSTSGVEPMIVGDSTALTPSGSLDDAAGQLTTGETLTFSKEDQGLQCQGQFASGTWTFSVSGTALTLQSASGASARLTKVGD